MITDNNGSTGSRGAQLTVQALPEPALTITSQPENLTVVEGETAIFSANAVGSGTLSYQWFVNDVAIPVRATGSSYLVLSANLNENGDVYRVEVSDANGTVSSNNATLTVTEDSVIDVDSPITIANIGQGTLDSSDNLGPRFVRVNFDSLATAVHTITVYWDSVADVRYSVLGADGTKVSPTIQGSNPGVWSGELDADTQYYLGLWSDEGIANYSVTIQAAVPLTITSQPSNITARIGSSATFFVEAIGSGIVNYQWFANGIALPGETSDSLTVLSVDLSEDGTRYSVEVSSGAETIISDTAILTVNEVPSLGLYSLEADASAWVLNGPAPTLDYQATENTDAWGRVLLRVGNVLLVGGDFTGIQQTRSSAVTDRPWLAAFNAVTGQPVTSFQVPFQIDSVVRSLVLSPDGSQVYVGGDFGLLVLDAVTGELELDVNVEDGNQPGRVFAIAVTNSQIYICLLYTSPSPRDRQKSRMPSSA